MGRFVGFFATTQTKTPKWWDVSVSPVLDAQGKPEMLLASSRDVTEYKRAERALRTLAAGTAAVPVTSSSAPWHDTPLKLWARGMPSSLRP